MFGNGFHSKILLSLLAIMLAMAVLPLVLVSWRLISINRESLASSQRELLVADVSARARAVEREADLAEERAVDLALAVDLAGGARAADDAWARGATARKEGGLLAVAVVAASGATTARATPGIPTGELEAAVRDAAAHLRANGTYFGPPRAAADGRVVAPVAAVIPSGGAVVTIADLGVSRDAKAGPLFAADGTPLGGSSPEAVRDTLREALRETLRPLAGEWASGGAKTVEREIERADGAKLLGAIATASLPSGQILGVAGTVDRSAALAPSNRMRSQAVWACIVAAFAALLAAALFAGRIVTPMRELARGARAIAGGDFGHRIRIWSKDEIGQLAGDFNRMADRLQGYVDELRGAVDDNRALFIGTVRGLAAAIDGKDPYTRGHSERVADYSAAIAAEMGLGDDEVEKIRIGGLMHDIGKLAIEDKILRKPAALTDEEFEIMREHPERGTKIMAEIPQMREYISGMRFHHEMLNGKGYPLGLAGDQIPLMARIVSVADTFDAMTTNRPYQKQMPIDVVFDKIRSMVGIRYDPKVVDALVAAYEHGRVRLRLHRAPRNGEGE